MVEQLINFFREQRSLNELSHLTLRRIEALFASTQQMFAIAHFQTEEEMIQNWARAAHQLTFKVQRNMPSELDELRWDMYLLLYVDSDKIAAENRKQIENNRFYFRKIVLTRSDLPHLADRLPISLPLPLAPSSEQTLFFDDMNFLNRLKECLTPQDQQTLSAFFTKGADNVEQLLLHLENARVTTGGDENVD